jgi:uncharacterized protein (TIGR02646 family)
MIRLDRAVLELPAGWDDAERRALPDLAAFRARAAAFEDLDLDGPVRRAGFKSFAPEVLPRLGRRKQPDFKPIWGKLKQALAEMSHQKCSYCESSINAERSAAVEHFRPKSLFPTLVYDRGNYFLGCGGCNGAKSDKWPAGGGAYVRPDEGDPEALFIFHEDGEIEAALPGGPSETIQDFGLKRTWLRKLRARAVRVVLEDLRSVIEEERIPVETRRKLARGQLTRIDPTRPYSAALRQCFRRVWNANDPDGEG